MRTPQLRDEMLARRAARKTSTLYRLSGHDDLCVVSRKPGRKARVRRSRTAAEAVITFCMDELISESMLSLISPVRRGSLCAFTNGPERHSICGRNQR